MPGLYYEEFEIGRIFDHSTTRTVTETDNLLFSALTHNPAKLHIDEHFMQSHEFGQRIVNSAFTLGLMSGVSVEDTTLGTTIGNLGWNSVRFPRPVFHGDTLHVRTTVIAKRESTSRPNAGIVTFTHEAFNQRDELVGTCERVALMLKKPVQ
ncbi:MaoC family dehydratase [Microbacterium pygmaeum]|uniref:Acyl dehydratase n=1 Tax=Microbacterium pygmaeum TaxID=370764 RepID=A0A1G7XLD4_9MICO|nr:MaoC family dehydratase [Microbacterium pygmaeum]SDG84886.1 Acyl dehydratase [Microbacterium pygmaeum]